MSGFQLGERVMTPNGPGTYDGYMWDQGRVYYLVRHDLAKMTGRGAGLCHTPKAVKTGLWQYEPEQVTRA